jgi:hypothetical protein
MRGTDFMTTSKLIRGLACAGVLTAFAPAASAQSPNFPSLNDRGICPGIQVFGENIPIRLVKVIAPAPRTHFVEDKLSKPKSDCPSGTASCQRKGFVVAGDDLLAGWKNGAYSCVVYIAPNAKRVKGQFAETTGYLPTAALKEMPAPPAKPADWLGTWGRSSEADITISAAAGGKVKIAGQANYGSLDPGRVARGAVNVGELEGEATPQGNLMAFGEDYTDPGKPLGEDRSECRARFQLVGRFLVVEDNVGCGGANVSFTGVYIRLK